MQKLIILPGLSLLLCCASASNAAEPPEIGIEEGQMYPDLMLPAVDGEVRRLSEFRGKRVLLFHFASW